jgi:hypothetical protein
VMRQQQCFLSVLSDCVLRVLMEQFHVGVELEQCFPYLKRLTLRATQFKKGGGYSAIA